MPGATPALNIITLQDALVEEHAFGVEYTEVQVANEAYVLIGVLVMIDLGNDGSSARTWVLAVRSAIAEIVHDVPHGRDSQITHALKPPVDL
jgi:hypothetical protein